MRRHAFALALAAIFVLLTGSYGQSQPAKPKVPPGMPTAGSGAVAVLSTGVDYTLPAVFNRLARDAEGEIIGYDAVDDDRRPYAPAGPDGDVTSLAAQWPMRFVHVRVDPKRPETLARAVAWIARSPARIVILAMWSSDPAAWEAFRVAAVANANLLFIVAAGDEGADIDVAPVYPAAFKLDNMIVVSAIASSDSRTAPNVGIKTIDLLAVPPAARREAPSSPNARVRKSSEATFALATLFFCYIRHRDCATTFAVRHRQPTCGAS